MPVRPKSKEEEEDTDRDPLTSAHALRMSQIVNLISQFPGFTAKIEAHRAKCILAEHHGDFSRVRQDLKDVPGHLVKATVRLPQQESARRLIFINFSIIICRPKFGPEPEKRVTATFHSEKYNDIKVKKHC